MKGYKEAQRSTINFATYFDIYVYIYIYIYALHIAMMLISYGRESQCKFYKPRKSHKQSPSTTDIPKYMFKHMYGPSQWEMT